MSRPEALDLTAENLELHGVGGLVTLARADLLGPAGGSLPLPDVVIANLPYVASAEVDARQGSLGYEPRVALDGGPDGLTLLRRLLDGLPTHAARGATVLLEIGVGQVGCDRGAGASGMRRSRSCRTWPGSIGSCVSACQTDRVTDVLPPTPEGLERAAALLRDGEMVAFPTDTVYGLGVSAAHPARVDALLRPEAAPRREADPHPRGGSRAGRRGRMGG